MDTQLRADVIILGGGLVGLTLALALDAHGLSAIVIDPADPAALHAPGFDGRASAIASASWRLLAAIGVAARLEGQGCAIRTIAVRDGLQKRRLRFDAAPDDDPLGIMVENRTLRRTLHEAAAGAANLRLLQPAQPTATERGPHGVAVTLADGRVARAPLLVAADGRGSATREAAGIRVARWRYDHGGIVTTLAHAHPHGHVAHEIFYPAGPFALLPLNDADGRHRSALVWSVAARDAAGLAGLGTRAFAAEVEKATGGMLGSVEVIAPRVTYPLGFHHAATITAPRLALIGDAAHGIHPIAGQGLNLGFRDAAALAEVLVDGARLGLDPGDAQLLGRYERWRGLDTLLVAAATDSLMRLFGLRGVLPRAARRFGLGAVERIGPLKSLFMAEARGETGELPKLLHGELV